jgi:hypothetical protein
MQASGGILAWLVSDTRRLDPQSSEENQMGEVSQPLPERQPPLVLRKVPPERQQLARSMTAQGADSAGGIWWELVDTAAPPELPAVGVALTHDGAGGCLTVSALGVMHADAWEEYAELLHGLVAALRRHAVDAVVISAADQVVACALVEVGFRQAQGGNDGNRYLIVL